MSEDTVQRLMGLIDAWAVAEDSVRGPKSEQVAIAARYTLESALREVLAATVQSLHWDVEMPPEVAKWLSANPPKEMAPLREALQPAGWRSEPTQEMLDAFQRGFHEQLAIRHRARFKPHADQTPRERMSAEEAGLRAMLAAAPSATTVPADAAMLDWLEQQCATVSLTFKGPGRGHDFCIGGLRSSERPSLRAAIRAAMATPPNDSEIPNSSDTPQEPT